MVVIKSNYPNQRFTPNNTWGKNLLLCQLTFSWKLLT